MLLNFQAYLSLPNRNQVNERLLHVQICVGAKELLLLKGETTTDLKNIVRFYKNYGQNELNFHRSDHFFGRVIINLN